MRAAVLSAIGGPLVVEDFIDPRPRYGEVLIQVAACGVCRTDLHVVHGEVPFPVPCVLGHEVSGTVLEVGPGVEGLEVGTRVVSCFIMPCGACRHCVRGHEDLCERFFAHNRLNGTLNDGTSRLARPDGQVIAMYSMGGLAELSVAPASSVFALPGAIPLEQAAVLGCSQFTALGAVRNAADLRTGETVATGGVGLNIVQMARAFGASRIIALDVTDEKLALAARFGATDTINVTVFDPVEAVRDLTGGRGVDVAFEALGRPETVETAIHITDDGGRVVLVGIAPVGQTAPMDITRVVRRKLRIRGSSGGRARTDMPLLLDLVASGRIEVAGTVSRTFDLDGADDAYRALEDGDILGRAIVAM